MALRISMLPCLALQQAERSRFEVIHRGGGTPSLAELHQQRVRISISEEFLISVNTKEQRLPLNIDLHVQYERVK